MIGAARRAKQEALVAAPAERGGFARVEAAARSAQGGAQGREKYRTLLDVGQATISRALSTAHRALPAGAPSAWRSATLWPISPSAPAACPGRAHRRRAARAGD